MLDGVNVHNGYGQLNKLSSAPPAQPPPLPPQPKKILISYEPHVDPSGKGRLHSQCITYHAPDERFAQLLAPGSPAIQHKDGNLLVRCVHYRSTGAVAKQLYNDFLQQLVERINQLTAELAQLQAGEQLDAGLFHARCEL